LMNYQAAIKHSIFEVISRASEELNVSS
jgi:hypothetical protein